MFSCASETNNTVVCQDAEGQVLGCCPPTAMCSQWGCTLNTTSPYMFVGSSRVVYTNILLHLVVIAAGLLEFAVAMCYYRARRMRAASRLQRSQEGLQNLVVNPAGLREAPPESGGGGGEQKGDAAASPAPLRYTDRLDGLCCGCGGVADAVLLPCNHAVCCFSCSERATHCPFCKEPCNDRLRLFAV